MTDQSALIQNNYAAISGASVPLINGSGMMALFDGKIVGLGVSCKTAAQECAVNMSWTTALNNGSLHDNVLVLPEELHKNLRII